jgi:subtilisin family serine protease
MSETRPSPARRNLSRRLLATTIIAVLGAALFPAAISASTGDSQRYIVVFKGDYALDGSYALAGGYALVQQYALDDTYALNDTYALGSGYALAEQYALTGLYALDDSYALTGLYALDGSYALTSGYALYALYALDDVYALLDNYALGSLYALTDNYALARQAIEASSYALGDNYALARDYALSIVGAAGGTVVADLSSQLGVMVIDSKNAAFAQVLSGYAIVDSVGQDFGWQQFPSYAQAVASGALKVVQSNTVSVTGGDPLESQQWSMKQIHAPQARAVQAGRKQVRVGVVDTGIDGNHLDFLRTDGTTNVDCAHGADFTSQGPGIGNPFACVDNNFHGTHVAGIIGAQPNGHGVVGIAPGVTLVPIKVCDADGHCYASDVLEGITYAGDQALNVINMSFYVDDDSFQQSTEFKCSSDSTQSAFRKAIERAISYYRGQGGTPIAALGNESADLAHPASNACTVVPAEVAGVTGVVALGPNSAKAGYSNYGTGAADVSAPGGDYVVDRDLGSTICQREVLSTIPGNLWGCFQGTSMASPHATGVAALIVSQFGTAGPNGTWKMAPTSVESKLQATTIDIGLTGYDECFGNGRIDALRAVQGTTKRQYDSSAPYCPEYNM